MHFHVDISSLLEASIRKHCICDKQISYMIMPSELGNIKVFCLFALFSVKNHPASILDIKVIFLFKNSGFILVYD